MRSELIFEELLPCFEVKGTIEVTEEALPGGTPSTVVSTGQNCEVCCCWETLGPLNHIMGGEWRICVYLEQMGEGEFKLPNAERCLPVVSEPHSYCAKIKIPAGAVPAGTYELTATVTMLGAKGVPGPVAGHGRIQCMQFYHAGPIAKAA